MKFVVKNARLSFPALFEARDYKNDGKFKWQGHFLIPKNDPQVAEFNGVMLSAAKEKWGAKGQSIFDLLKSDNKLCFNDGKRKPENEEYEGMMFISASNSKIAPDVRRRDKTKADPSEANTLFYPGAIVLGVLDIYCQDNDFGKRINATLNGVQFIAHGERFAGAPAVAEESDFEDLAEGADAEDFI